MVMKFRGLGNLKRQASRARSKLTRYAEEAKRLTKAGTWYNVLEEDFLNHGFEFTITARQLFSESAFNVDAKLYNEKKDEIAAFHIEQIRNFK